MDHKTEQNRRIAKNTIVAPKQLPQSKTGFYTCNNKNRELIAGHVDSFKGVIDVLPNFGSVQPKAHMTGTVNHFTVN